MKILLVLPAAEHLRIAAERAVVPKRKMLRFSLLPLTTVAALTPPEHQVSLCDENVTPLDYDADVAVVGITFMTALAPRAREIAREFRRRGKVVVAGGYHATLFPEDVAPHFDAVVVGEAEGAWPRLLADVERGRLENIYRNDGLCDPAEIPTPRRDLTAGTGGSYVTTDAVQAGRGCAHACRYCSVTAFYRHTYRARPVARVIEEVRGLPRNFMFVDDNIFADRDYASRLFRELAPLKKRWVSQGDIQVADDPELLELAARAGCKGLFIGVETLSAENLEAVGKAFNNARRYCERIAAVRRAGIGVVAGIILGMDHDDVGVFERMLRFLDEARIDAVQVNIMTPLPGTPLFEDYERQGRIVDRDWSHYDFRHVVMQPARMTRRELQAGADWLYAQFYSPARILKRFLRSAFTLGPMAASLAMRLNWTYRYDNQREGIVGHNPARTRERVPSFVSPDGRGPRPAPTAPR